jgi:hypothetical protein
VDRALAPTATTRSGGRLVPYRDTAGYRIRRRVLARAQGRARTRLLQAHHEEYRRYYEEEKELAYRELSDEDKTALSP